MGRPRGEQKKETHGLGREDVCQEIHNTNFQQNPPRMSLLKTSSSPTQWLDRVHLQQHIAPAFFPRG